MRVVGCCEGACVAGGDEEACEGAVTLDVCELLAVSELQAALAVSCELRAASCELYELRSVC